MRLKIFLISLLISLPFWWGVNVFQENLEDFLFWKGMADNPQLLTAQIIQEEKLESLKPIRNWQIEDLKIEAKSVISVLVDSQNSEKILYEKAGNKKLPIASLTKLMTANVVLENYDLSQKIRISETAVDQEEEFGKLKAGKTFQVKYLLYPLLMESSNDAAYALANDYNEMTEESFVSLMNLEAESLGLENTHFVNPTGLDSNPPTALNYSTAEDLVNFTKYLLKKPLIWEILSTPKFDLYGPELINTNELLGYNLPTTQINIIGGKTGWTPEAGGCFLLVMEVPRSSGYIINVILGSGDRFEEMKKLVDWLYQAYRW